MPVGLVSADFQTFVAVVLSCWKAAHSRLSGWSGVYPKFLDVVRAFRAAGMGVGVCTNATTLDEDQIAALADIGGVHCHVSLDGFRAESHGKFRGDKASFAITIETIKQLAHAGLLQGLLCTPNSCDTSENHRRRSGGWHCRRSADSRAACSLTW